MKTRLLSFIFLFSLYNSFGQLQRGTWILDANTTWNKKAETDFQAYVRDLNIQTNTGYFVNRHLLIGLSSTWNRNTYRYTNPQLAQEYNSTDNTVFFSPYLRYYFDSKEKYHFFVETQMYHHHALYSKYPGQGIDFIWSLGMNYFINPNMAIEATVSDETQNKDIGIGLGLKYFVHTVSSTKQPKAIATNYIQKHKVTYSGNIALRKTTQSLDLDINLTIRYFLTHRLAVFLQPHSYHQLKRPVRLIKNQPQIGLSIGLERHFLLTPKSSLYWSESWEMPSFEQRQSISPNYEFFEFYIRSAVGINRFIAPNLSWLNVVYSDFYFDSNEQNLNFKTGFQHFF